jgi:hypothetical protein
MPTLHRSRSTAVSRAAVPVGSTYSRAPSNDCRPRRTSSTCSTCSTHRPGSGWPARPDSAPARCGFTSRRSRTSDRRSAGITPSIRASRSASLAWTMSSNARSSGGTSWATTCSTLQGLPVTAAAASDLPAHGAGATVAQPTPVARPPRALTDPSFRAAAPRTRSARRMTRSSGRALMNKATSSCSFAAKTRAELRSMRSSSR